MDLEELDLNYSSRERGRVSLPQCRSGLVTATKLQGHRRLQGSAAVILEAEADPGAEIDEETLKILTMLEKCYYNR